VRSAEGSARRRRLALASLALASLALGAGAAIMACDAVLGIPNRQLYANAADCTASKCMCSLGFADCDQNPANGCETQVDSDVHNCGSCSHDCLGGACVASQCQPFQPGSHFADPIVYSGGSLYIGGCNDPTANCTLGPALVQVPTTCNAYTCYPYDSCSRTLWTYDGAWIVSLSVTDSDVYWTVYWESTNGSFATYTIPLDGGALRPLGFIPVDSYLVAASGTALYYTNWGPGPPGTGSGLYRITFDGGTPSPSTTITDAVVLAAAVDTMNVYYTDPTPDGGVYACPHNGTIPSRLVADVGVAPIVLEGSTLYVGGSSIRSVPIDGGSPTIVVQDAGTSGMVALALDKTHFYWGGLPIGGLSRVLRDGGSLETLAPDASVGANTLAVDDCAIYWAPAPFPIDFPTGPLQMLAK
jgi:hypothetical protein